MIKWYAYKIEYIGKEKKQYDEICQSKAHAVKKARQFWNESDTTIDVGVIKTNSKTGDTKRQNFFTGLTEC